MGYRLMVPQIMMEDIWEISKSQADSRGGLISKEWGVFVACTCWQIWKRRNERIFTGTSTPLRYLADRIMVDARLWIKYCNRGRRTLMGTNLLQDPD